MHSNTEFPLLKPSLLTSCQNPSDVTSAFYIFSLPLPVLKLVGQSISGVVAVVYRHSISSSHCIFQFRYTASITHHNSCYFQHLQRTPTMALDVANSSPPSCSYFQKTVTLQDWWLTKPQTNDHTNTLGVAGLTSQQNRAARCFSSAPILKIYGFFELETVDGVCVILQGFINKDRTLENGFSPEVFDHFVIGFPPNWKEFSTNCPKSKTAAKSVTTEEDGQDSIEGHDDFHGKPQNCDSYTMDIGVEDNKDILLSNKTITPLNPPSDEIPHEHKIEAGNEVLCVSSPVTRGFEDDSSLKTSPIVSNTVDSSTGSRCLGVSSRRITRSMKKMDNSENSFPPVNDISNSDKGTSLDPGILGSSKSSRKDINGVFSNNKKAVDVVDSDMKFESRNIISKSSGGCGKRSNEPARCSRDTGSRMKSKQKQSGHIVDVVITKDVRCGIANQEKNKNDVDANDNTVLTRTNMKGCRNKKENRAKAPQEEGVPATHGITFKEAIMTRSKSRTKLPVIRKLITSPKSTPSRGITRSKSKIKLPVKRKLITSPKSTPSRGMKGSEERYGSANILPLESFSGKKSRSGRVVLPPLEFWRNQMVVHDEDGQLCGVQEPK